MHAALLLHRHLEIVVVDTPVQRHGGSRLAGRLARPASGVVQSATHQPQWPIREQQVSKDTRPPTCYQIASSLHLGAGQHDPVLPSAMCGAQLGAARCRYHPAKMRGGGDSGGGEGGSRWAIMAAADSQWISAGHGHCNASWQAASQQAQAAVAGRSRCQQHNAHRSASPAWERSTNTRSNCPGPSSSIEIVYVTLVPARGTGTRVGRRQQLGTVAWMFAIAAIIPFASPATTVPLPEQEVTLAMIDRGQVRVRGAPAATGAASCSKTAHAVAARSVARFMAVYTSFGKLCRCCGTQERPESRVGGSGQQLAAGKHAPAPQISLRSMRAAFYDCRTCAGGAGFENSKPAAGTAAVPPGRRQPAARRRPGSPTAFKCSRRSQGVAAIVYSALISH